MKKYVDSYQPQKLIPHCRLRAATIETESISDLSYRVKLIGAKEPLNEFVIYLKHNKSNETCSACYKNT